VLVAVPLVAGCGGSAVGTTTTDTAATATTTSNPSATGSTSAPGTTPTSAAGQEFTAGQLAEFDGADGRPAYVAVDGVVYDVSASARWSEGIHFSCNLGASAGRDLSDVISQAPANMRSLLSKMPMVGTLVE